MKKWILCIGALLGLSSLQAQITIDGSLGDASWVSVGSGSSRDCFGSDNNVTDLVYTFDASNIYIGANLSLNGNNKLLIFMDFSSYGGRAAGLTLNAINGGIDGTSLGNEVDFVLDMDEGNSSTDFYINAHRLGSSGGLSGGFLGNIASQSGTSASFNTASAWGGTGSLTVAYNNGGAGSDFGVEFSIPRTAFPGVTATSTIKLFALITNNTGFASNESVPAFLGTCYTGATCAGTDVNLTSCTAFSSAFALPIELKSFDGKYVGRDNQLTWVTATEQNNRGFEVERSSNGREFETIGFVTGANNSQIEKTYQFVDNQPIRGANYYRLRQIDFDGRSSTSKVIRVMTAMGGVFTVAPNPVHDHNIAITVSDNDTESDIQLALFGMDGTLIRTQQFAPATQLNWYLPELPAGVYTLRVNGGSAVRIIKM
jgi:hypothetical protein